MKTAISSKMSQYFTFYNILRFFEKFVRIDTQVFKTFCQNYWLRNDEKWT